MRGDRFKLLTGEDVLSDYRWLPSGRSESGPTYQFCSRCGIRLYATGEWAEMGRRFFAANVPTLDNVDREQLAMEPLNYIDNAHDRPDRAPADIRLM